MAKNYIYIQGKANWCRFVKPNQWNKWGCQIHPNAEGLEAIRDMQARGAKNVIKKDDDGYYTNIGRPVSKEYVKSGKTQAFVAPIVVDKDNKPIDGNIVGNGSDVTLKVEWYEHGTPGGGKAVALRLESVRVDNLVPYEPDRDMNDFDKESVAGLKEQPEQLF
jgi:hypothetical protein